MINHYGLTESYRQTQRRKANEAHAAYERQLREGRVQRMNAAVEASIRQQAALRRLGGGGGW